MTPEATGPESLARFNHHPDPAIDFCIEVEELENIYLERALPEVVNPDDASLERRVAQAMYFRVGGDLRAIDAKAALRRLEVNLTARQPTVQEDARVEQIITILRDTLFVQHGMEDSHHVFGVDGIGEAALAIARSGSGGTAWQPIETAPKDIEVLLCAGPPETLGAGFLHWKYGVGTITYSGAAADWPWAFPPTAWQPLPAPPPAGAGE